MTNYTSIQTSYSEIKDPQLKKFVDHLKEIFSASIYQAAYHRSSKKEMTYTKLKVGVKKTMDYASVGEVTNQWLATKKPDQVKRLSQSGMTFLKFSEPIKSNDYILQKLDLKREFSYINDKLIFNRFGSILGVDNESSASHSDSGSSSVAAAKVLKLNLKKVKCLDDTVEMGKDEISVGGVLTDDKGKEILLSEFSVGSFETGDQKTFSPVKVLQSFALDGINPSTFLAFLTIAEKDSGGFSEFLSKLYEAIKAEVAVILGAVGAVAGTAIGAAIGGTVGTSIAGPLGTIIGAVAGLILGALIGLLVSVLKDELYEPQITGVILESNLAFTGPVETLTYNDHGGSYLLSVFWSAN